MASKRKVYSRLREHFYRVNLERESRGDKPFNQSDLAERSGLTHKTVSLWMNGAKELDRIDTKAWLSLADVLEVNPDDLLRVEDEKRSLPQHITTEFTAVAMPG